MNKKTYLEIVAELEKGATAGPWRVEAGELTYEGPYGTAHVIPPEPIAWEDTHLVAFLRNTLGEVQSVVKAAKEIRMAVDEEADWIAFGRALDALDAKAREVSE